jgi:hypothetical protein
MEASPDQINSNGLGLDTGCHYLKVFMQNGNGRIIGQPHASCLFANSPAG